MEEEERKREENERAFRKWIELKQKEAQEKSSKKMDEDKNNNKKMSVISWKIIKTVLNLITKT